MSLREFCGNTYHGYFNWMFDDYDNFTGAGIILFSCKLPMWIVGILGNLMNLIVFAHKNMAHRPINSIFWWLSMSDLLELTILALYQWCFAMGGGLGIFLLQKCDVYNECVLILIYAYLFQVIHTTTIALNIFIVFYQYMVVAHPLMNQKNSCNNQSIKRAVIWIYILSFALYLPFWYTYEIVEDFQPSKFWLIHMRRRSSGDDSYERRDLLINVCLLVFGVVLRIGPLMILIILCISLLFAIRNAHRNRQDLGLQACHLSKQQRNVNRMNITVAVVMIMFFITEVPLAITRFLMRFENLDDCSASIDLIILLPSTLLNCCYSIICYLFRIKQYRETLKLLLSKSNWVSSRARVIEQTDLELHPL